LLLSGGSVNAEETNGVDDELLVKLQGEWDPESSVFDGKENAIDRDKRSSFAIKDRFMYIRFGEQDQVVGKFEIKLLVAAGPMGHIDYEMVEPRRDGITVKQLFKLEGDRITTCVTSPPGQDRPSELTSEAGSKRLLTVSRRRKSGSAGSD